MLLQLFQRCFIRFESDDFDEIPYFSQPTNILVTGGNFIGSRVREKMMHSKSGELQSDQMFPMVTVPLDTLLKMTEMHAHEKLTETWQGLVWLQGSAASKYPSESSEPRENCRASKRKVEVAKNGSTSHDILNHNRDIYAWEYLLCCPDGAIIGLLLINYYYLLLANWLKEWLDLVTRSQGS